MVSPNLANINSLYAFSKNARLSRTEQSILYNSYSTLFRINSILAINNNTTTWASVTLPYLNYGTNIKSNIINTVLPPLSNATVLLDKQNGIFLEESDELFGISNVNNSVDLVLTYDEFNDGGLVRAEYLSVAGGAGGPGGGGSGGWFTAGSGGGGALQGVIYLPLATVPVVVGGGGAGGTASPCSLAGNGSNSSINNQAVAIGGGRGSGFWNGPLLPVTSPGSWLIAAEPGGSGGGTHYYTYTSPYGICYVIGEEGKGTPRQGCPGGRWEGNPVGAGGGGAGQAGYSCHGGNGILSGITGTFCYYGGGSGAGGVNGYGGGRAGCGGGAIGRPAGTSGSGFAGNVNTGGAGSGGAAGGGNEPFYPGAAGGSGIVIITYPGPAKYDGGTISCVGNKVVHCFTASGNLTYCSRVLLVDYLVVAGGGAGGDRFGGGGGGGGFRTGYLTLTGSSPIAVLVGAGGVSSPLGGQSPGSNSCIGTICSTGGGFGVHYNSPLGTICGVPGGSGGGGGGSGQAGAPGNVPSTSPPQGYPGAPGSYNGTYFVGGGGGGGSACGTAGSGSTAGDGGCGGNSCITGTLTFYSGGGGGGRYDGSNTAAGSGGCGGGGRGTAAGAGCCGTVNTGGGGGGQGGEVPCGLGGAGGSGIVIIAYPLPCRASGGTITCVSGKVVHTFTSSGNLCILS